MKRILIHYPILNLGGAERSTIRLMNLMLEEGWKVHLVLTTGGGSLEPSLDPRIRVTHLRSIAAGERFKTAKSWYARLKVCSDLTMYCLSRCEQLVKSVGFLFRYYDAAMVSLHGLSPVFVCRWVRAGKRLQWIRNDLALCDQDGKAQRHIEQFGNRIDYYLGVSETARDSVATLVPAVAEKALVVYNVIDRNGMESLAAASFENPYSAWPEGIRVVTVCRLSDKAKALLRMVDVQRQLQNDGIYFHWFVVGDGPDRQLLEDYIRSTGMQEWFILVGYQENPFPFYCHADLAATLSNYEGLCGAVNEAKIAGRPVIATRFSGIDEQLVHGKNGWVVENETDAIVAGMRELISSSALRNSMENNFLPHRLFDDREKLARIEQLIDA